MGTYRGHLYEGADGPLLELLANVNNQSSFVADVLSRFVQEMEPTQTGDRSLVQAYISDPAVCGYLDSQPRGGVARMIRAALYWELGRRGALDIDRLAQSLAGKLQEMGLMVQGDPDGQEDLDEDVMASLGQWVME